LKRLIQREVQDPLAMRLLAGEVSSGDRVVVDADGQGNLVFRIEPQPLDAEAGAGR
jgi:ATP-dependent Clp protease ATP-binding subunit ClpB